MDHFFGTIMQVVYAGVAPKDALDGAAAEPRARSSLDRN